MMKNPIPAVVSACLALASCASFREAQMHDGRIEQLTRDFVAGRISAQRYHDLCNVVNNGWRFVKTDDASGGSSAFETPPSTDSDDKEADKRALQEHQRRRAIGEAYEKSHPSPPPKAR